MALHQAEAGTPGVDITRKLFSEGMSYAWRKRFGRLGTPEIRELRQLREENARLRSLVAVYRSTASLARRRLKK